MNVYVKRETNIKNERKRRRSEVTKIRIPKINSTFKTSKRIFLQKFK